jgi:ubiquinone biosynthesis protein
MRRETTRERFHERVRLLQVYETFLRYGADAMFDRRALGTFRRRMQTWLYQTKHPVERLPAPVKMRLLLQELGPTYVKFGQIVSSRADSVPQEWERELAMLQSDVQPFPVEEAREVVESELGAPPEEVFASFDPVPLAAASLGQVHRATLEDDREVVVKVQRPRIEDKVRSDLRILAQAARTLERRTAWARELGAQGMIDEFGETLLRELDYTIEAYNARRLAQNLASIEGVHIPEMIRPLCSRRVLTMEFVDGVPATHRDEIVAAGLDPVAIADSAVRASIKMLLIDGFFHADPHPGNVLVSLDTGILTFLDTGMVGTLTLRQRFALVNLLETAGERDPLALAQALRGLSEPLNGTPPDPQAFDQDFVEAEAPLLDVEEGERLQLARLMGDAVDLLHEHGLRPDPQLSVALKAMMQAEEFTKVLYPPGSSAAFVEKATQMSRELVEQAVTKDAVAGFARKQASIALRQAAQNLPSLQDVGQMWLRQLGAGKFQVAIDTSDLDPQIERVEDSVRIVTVALMLVGLLIASAIAATAGVSGSLEPLRRFALVTYAVSAVVAAIVVLAMGRRLLRRGRGGRR